MMFRRSLRIQDNELRDLAQKIRQANQLKERADSELPVVSALWHVWLMIIPGLGSLRTKFCGLGMVAHGL